MDPYILIAKKNDLLRVSMVRVLGLNGINNVFQAHGSNDLLEKVERSKFDLLIVDKKIFSKCKKQIGRLKKEKSFRVILINNNGKIEKNERRSFMNIANAIIEQESKPQILIDTIKKVLAGKKVRKCSKRRKTR